MDNNFIKSVYEAYHPAKIIFIGLSTLTILIFLPLYYFVIWYERYGHDDKRTLINQLIASMCKVVMVYITFGISGEILIALWGPFPQWYCQFQLILKMFSSMIIILLIDCTLIVRYVLIFWVKNICIIHDDFWNMFLLLWVVCFGGILQLVYVFMPGKLPLDAYVCFGALPKDYLLLPSKSRSISIIVLGASILLGVVSTARIKLLKRKIVAIETNLKVSLMKLDNHDSNLLVRRAWFLAAIAGFMIIVLIYVSLYQPFTSDAYPLFFVNFYWLLHIIIPFSVCSVWSTVFASQGSMRKELVKETKKFLQSFVPNSIWVNCQD